jgi:hypothetical protein
VYVKIILKWIWNILVERAWSGLIWLRVVKNSRMLGDENEASG